MKCRHCGSEVTLSFVDLGTAPPSNAYLVPERLSAAETWYPLRVLTCTRCWLVQTEDYAGRSELFDAEYAYFSSYSSSWLEHAERYVREMTQRFALTSDSLVLEVAANDGYLLQYALRGGLKTLGIEPTASTAKACRARGIEVIEEFFGRALAQRLRDAGLSADVTVANNVLAHVPDINDFAAGFAIILGPQGVATFEFPHLLQLIRYNQFDTIYHEHFSYLSLTSVQQILEQQGLTVFDVQELPTHGGSLRVFAQRAHTGRHPVAPAITRLLESEQRDGVSSARLYNDFQAKAQAVKHDVLRFLLRAKQEGKRVGAYGAAAKGNTLLNYAGVRPDLLPWVVDRNPTKQGKFLPGSRIPIVDEDHLRRERPDYVWILPWNLREEIMNQLAYVREWGGRFVLAVPTLEIV